MLFDVHFPKMPTVFENSFRFFFGEFLKIFFFSCAVLTVSRSALHHYTVHYLYTALVVAHKYANSGNTRLHRTRSKHGHRLWSPNYNSFISVLKFYKVYYARSGKRHQKHDSLGLPTNLFDGAKLYIYNYMAMTRLLIVSHMVSILAYAIALLIEWTLSILEVSDPNFESSTLSSLKYGRNLHLIAQRVGVTDQSGPGKVSPKSYDLMHNKFRSILAYVRKCWNSKCLRYFSRKDLYEQKQAPYI